MMLNTDVMATLAESMGIPSWKFKIAQGAYPSDDLAAAVKEAKEAHFAATAKSEKIATLHHWEALSLQHIKQVTTLEEAWQAYEDNPSGGPAEIAGLQKIFSFASTHGEVRTIYQKTQRHRYAKLVRHERLNDLFLQEVKSADTLEKLEELYFIVPHNCPAEKAILNKMLELASA